jgi:hypothetical protein
VLVPSGESEKLGAAMATIVERIRDYDHDSIQRDCMNRFGRASVVARLSAVYQDVIDRRSRIADCRMIDS